jgi:antitoxin HigA-1
MAHPENRMRPVHPGEVLREDYLTPLGLSVNALAQALGVPATRIHEIVKERRGITADTAARLAKHFGGDAASWLALQAQYDVNTLPTAPGDRQARAAARARGGVSAQSGSPRRQPLRHYHPPSN